MTPGWIDPGVGFGLENLPWCRFHGGRLGVAVGDYVLDLDALGLPYDRARIAALLEREQPHAALIRQSEVRFELPFRVGNYTDFYASLHHAIRVGQIFRPGNPLLPNYRHVPIAYHGRASSVVISGTPVQRPHGQLGQGRFGPTAELDYELELGCWIGVSNPLGTPVPVEEAHNRIAGFCLVNDWSARDIQRWEYQPLGPFLGKSFATSVSPWVVVPEALAPYRVPAPVRPELLPYLRPPGYLYDITAEVWVNGVLKGRSNARDLFWTWEQMIAHHTSNGCNLERGDLLASGTLSSEAPEARGCLLEWGEGFLNDGDEVVLRAYAERPGLPRIGFGECRGVVKPARAGFT